MAAFKPAGYNTVSPYLIVSDARATIDFLATVFSAALLRSFPDADGRLIHAEVRIDDTVPMLADSAPEWPPVPAYVHAYVPDVNATYSRALAAGATSVQERWRKTIKTSAAAYWMQAARPGGLRPGSTRADWPEHEVMAMGSRIASRYPRRLR